MTLPAVPVQLSTFVGRAPEVEEARRLLAGTRLLTLTGAGGSGKTRLAVEVAAREAGEVGWVELAGLADPELLASRVAEQLGRADGSVDRLVELIGARAPLLVLDNCEHLVDAVAALVETLLRRCPGLRVLATSREALGIAGERAWMVPALAPADAERLFVERARDVSPGFAGDPAVVAEICRRLDHLPLAIELAAARVRLLGLPQLLARLDDSFRVLTSSARHAIPRHKTLRATIDWSYALCGEDEQHLLDRLSVFRGGFTLDAAEVVCEAQLDVLGRLVDRSLVTMREELGAARYALLETVRQYAGERLRARGETAALERRHAEHFASEVAAAEPHLVTGARRVHLERLQHDLDNLRRALAWSREHDPALHLTLAGQLCWFWYSTGLWSEGRRLAEGALADTTPTRARAAALFAAGVIASLQSDVRPAEAWLAESAAIARRVGDARLEAYARNYLGLVLISLGRPEGEAEVQAALAWFRANEDLYGLRLSLLLLGTIDTARGELERALVAMEEAVAVARRFGLPRELGIALQMLGSSRLKKGELDRAEPLFRESLAALRQDPQPLFLARGLEMLGAVACERGEVRQAIGLFGAGEAIRERIGARMLDTDRAHLEPRLAALRAAVSPDDFAAAWAEGKKKTTDEALAEALARTPAPPAPAPRPERTLRVRALGALEVTLDGASLDWASGRARELLLYLLCHPGGRTREQIGLAFWPDASTAQVKNSFHVLLHRLRKVIGSEAIALEDERYRVALATWFDAAELERAARAGRVDEALALYRGDFLDGETVGEWALEVQDRLRRKHHELLSTAADRRLAAGQLGEAVELLERLVQADPLREEAHRRLMRGHARAGESARAIAQFDRLVTSLRRELGAAPARETVGLVEQIRRGEPV